MFIKFKDLKTWKKNNELSLYMIDNKNIMLNT